MHDRILGNVVGTASDPKYLVHGHISHLIAASTNTDSETIDTEETIEFLGKDIVNSYLFCLLDFFDNIADEEYKIVIIDPNGEDVSFTDGVEGEMLLFYHEDVPGDSIAGAYSKYGFFKCY